jgi:anaerobic ribonucleoside-triphosphate reductase
MYYRPRITEVNGKTMVGNGTNFERTRRITGYLVGALDRFNNAKRCEEKDRVKHSCGNR